MQSAPWPPWLEKCFPAQLYLSLSLALCLCDCFCSGSVSKCLYSLAESRRVWRHHCATCPLNGWMYTAARTQPLIRLRSWTHLCSAQQLPVSFVKSWPGSVQMLQMLKFSELSMSQLSHSRVSHSVQSIISNKIIVNGGSISSLVT